MSSAYSEILYIFSPSLSPSMDGLSLMAAASGSIASANSSGDIGHPCLVPRARAKPGDLRPLVMTLAVGEEYNILTHLINASPNLNLESTENKYGHSTLSNAFSASNEMTNPEFAY